MSEIRKWKAMLFWTLQQRKQILFFPITPPSLPALNQYRLALANMNE